MKKKKVLVLGGILLLGIGFAAVSTTLYINGNVNISANTEDFDVRFTRSLIDSEDKSSEVISEDGKTINFTTKELEALNDKSVLDFEITNNSSLYDAEVSIECTSGERNEYYQITKEVANVILAKTTEQGSIEVEKIKMAPENIEESFTCTLNAVAHERTTKGEEPVKVNKNIVNNDLECLKNKEAGSCGLGTEIRYMVNDSLEKTFNVLHDDGDTLTLQDSVNTIEDVAWYFEEDNTKGPLTALEALEGATSGWNNVNTQNYTMGTTNFNGISAYTGCSFSEGNYSCTTNTYTWDSRDAKARMITAQEASAIGCSSTKNSCPSWMLTSDWYWIMSAYSGLSHLALYIHTSNGNFENGNITGTRGARAVVEINKFN